MPDLIDSRIVPVDADTSVEDACEVGICASLSVSVHLTSLARQLLLVEDIPCLTVRSRTTEPSSGGSPYHGLFDVGKSI